MGSLKAASPPKRKDPMPLQRDEVLREAGYKCGNPTCRNIITLELHHIEWVKDGGPTVPSNLLALCPMCHALHTQGHIPASAVRHWKGLLVALNGAFSKEAMDLLLFLSTKDIEKLWYSADGLLKFAGLIAAGLVVLAQSAIQPGRRETNFSGAMDKTLYKELPENVVRLCLSEKGRLLVASWLKGDEATFVKALAVKAPAVTSPAEKAR